MPDPVGAVLSLRRDPGNVFDENAIAVHNGEDCSLETHIGYLQRDLVKLVSDCACWAGARAWDQKGNPRVLVPWIKQAGCQTAQ